MAQDSKPTAAPPEHEGESPFHYYSGGEVKEMAQTRVSPVMLIFWTLIIIGAVLFLIFGGALGPRFGGFKPVGATHAREAQLEGDLASRTAGTGVQMVSTLDLSRIPLPKGQNLTQAIAAGTLIYQTYCIGCHGQNQDGNGVNAGALNPKPRNLRDAPFMQAMSYQRITTSVHKGVPGTAMPRWENTLSEDNIKDVISYVLSLTTPLPAAAAAAPAPAANQAGDASRFVNGVQSSPKPITPPVNGNPAAPTNTAPPSQSRVAQPTGVPAVSGNRPIPVRNPSPLAGGRSAAPIFQLHPRPTHPTPAPAPAHPMTAPAPKPAAPVPGGAKTNQMTTQPHNGGTGM